METMKTKCWWHVYGGVSGDVGWVMVIAGESDQSPERVDNQITTALFSHTMTKYVLKHLASFEHEPTEAEKKALTPEEYWNL